MRGKTFIFIVAWFVVVAFAAFAKAQATTRPTTQPTLVTLKLQRVPATQALSALMKQAEVPFPAGEHMNTILGSVKVTAQCTDRPFALAMLDVFAQCGIEPAQSPTSFGPTSYIMRPVMTKRWPRMNFSVQNELNLYPPGTSWVTAPAFEAGPFVLIAREARRESRIDLESGSRLAHHAIDLSFLLLRDPKLHVYGISDVLEVTEARDTRNRSLPPAQPASASKPKPLYNTIGSNWTIRTSLKDVTSARKLALLRGRVHAMIVAKSQDIDLLDEKSHPITGELKTDNFTITIRSFEETSEGSTLAVTLDYPSASAGGTQDPLPAITPLLHRDNFTAADASGRLYWINSDISATRDNRYFDVNLRFRPYQAFRDDPSATKKPAKITWHVPVAVEETAFAVEIRDLDLP